MSRLAAGLKAWSLQRLSALYVGIYLLFLLLQFLLAPFGDFAAWKDWVASPLISISAALFVLMLLLHAWVGVRDILMDYVKPVAVRALLLSLVMLWLLGCGLWAGRVLLLTGL